MNMNAGLILAGQQPDFLGGIDAANRAAQFKMQAQRENAFARMMQEQGPGILAGDPNAMNAFAQFDPAAALGIQDQRLGMEAQRQSMGFNAEKMQMLREEGKRAAAEQARQLTKEQRAEEAAKIERAVAAGLAARSPEQWDALMQSLGAPDLVGQFEQREAIAYSYMGVADALKAEQGPDTADRFKVVGNQVVDLSAEGGPAAVFSGQGQEEVIFGADGKPVYSKGPAGTAKPFTEAQSKDVVFATRAEGALGVLDPVANALTSRGDTVLDKGPLGLGREFQAQEFQLARQAGDEFLQAILRKDTGAAITAQEQELYGRTFLPQPGDNDAVLAQKAQSRRRAVEALKAGMSATQIVAQELALQRTAPQAQPTGPTVVDGFTIEELP